MGNKYTKEDIQKLLEKYNYVAVGDIVDLKTKVQCKTQDGYTVMVTPSGVKQRGDSPRVFSIYNPYTIENIKLWIQKNNFTCKLISMEFKGNKSQLEWQCECGQHYFSNWGDVYNYKKSYCNYCAKSKRYDNLVDYNSLVLAECWKRGYELISKHDITRSDTKFQYICNKHREYGMQTSFPNNFITDYGTGGCYACGIEKRSLKRRKDESYFRAITEQVGLIYVRTEYSDNDRTRIVYRYKKHYDKGEFSTYITNIKNNKGQCPCCKGQYRTQYDLQKEVDNLQSHLEILEYDNYSSPITCKCTLCGNIWKTFGVYLTQGHTCPNCSKSKFELSVENVLKKSGLSYISQYKFEDCKDINCLPFDFYLSDYNIAIEVDGEGHYQPIKYSSSWSDEDIIKNFEKIQKHDSIKTEYCNSKNISLIRIPYYEKENLVSYLANKFHELKIAI